MFTTLQEMMQKNTTACFWFLDAFTDTKIISEFFMNDNVLMVNIFIKKSKIKFYKTKENTINNENLIYEFI
jgi:hypothetical protein